MKYIIKSLIFVIIMTISLIPVISCSSSGDTGQTVIKYYRWAGDLEEGKIARRLFKIFMKQNPDIKVIYNDDSWDGYWDKLQTRMAAGDAPDVFMNHAFFAQDFFQRGATIDLQPYTETLDMNDFYQLPFKMYTFDGNLHALPRDLNTIMLYYNKDLFDQQGVTYPDKSWTWKDYLSAAKRLTLDKNGDKITDVWGAQIEVNYELYYGNFIAQNGGQMLSSDKKTARIDDPAVREALSFIFDLVHSHKVAPDPVSLGSIGSAIDLFETGRVAMVYSGTWRIKRYQKAIKDFEWDMTMLPKGRKRAVICNGIAHSISKDCKNPDAAWKLVKFLSGKEAQTALARSGSSLPIRKSIANSKHFLNGNYNAGKQAALDTIPYGVNYPMTSRLSEWLEKFNDHLDEVNLGETELTPALNEAKKEIDKILSEGK